MLGKFILVERRNRGEVVENRKIIEKVIKNSIKKKEYNVNTFISTFIIDIKVDIEVLTLYSYFFIHIIV